MKKSYIGISQIIRGESEKKKIGNHCSTVTRYTKIRKTTLGAIQKIRVKLGGREGSCYLTQNVTVGEGGVQKFYTRQF